MTRLTPERPKEVYAKPCKHCPSEWHPQDPEAEDLLNACVEGKISEEDLLFVCAWRREKICRGLWNRLQEKKAC